MAVAFASGNYTEKHAMVMIALVLLVLWLLGFFTFHIAGGLIHILLVIAIIVVLVRIIRGRRVF
jgi:hypothetical protein